VKLQERLSLLYRDAVKAAKEAGDYDPKHPPLDETVLIHDVTGEAVLLAMSPDFNGGDARGVLLHRDELSGWFLAMNKYRSGDYRQLYLQAWSGGPFHRKLVKGPVYVPDCFLSIFGTIQPEVAQQVFGGSREDGLTARFGLVAVVPQTRPRLVDKKVDPQVSEAYGRAMTRLREVRDRVVKFAPEAWEMFSQWYSDLMARPEMQQDTPFKYHLAKYPSLLGRLALLFHFLEHGVHAPELVSLETADAARRLIDEYLETHARRLYGIVSAHALHTGAKPIAEWVREKRVETFRTRDILRKGWKEFKREDAQVLIERTLDYLEARDWLRFVQVPAGPAGGRPTRMAVVNPRVFGDIGAEAA
jgi:hypothetical protein